MRDPQDETPLKRYLIANRLTVTALAFKLGLDRAYVSVIVNGWATRATVRRWAPLIAGVLGVPVATVFPDLEGKTNDRP